MSKYLKRIAIPIIAVLLGLVAGALIMWLSGYDAFLGYQTLWQGIFSSSDRLGETIVKVTPLIFSGLAVAFAFRTGLFNIGVEGQMLVGWVIAVWVGINFEGLPIFLHLPLAIMAAAVAGGLWGLIPGILKAKLHVHEVIVTIMMNYIALHLTNFMISHLLTDGKITTEKVYPSASLGWSRFAEWTNHSRLHWGIVLALIAAVVFWLMLEKSTKGFELRAVGFNQKAAEYAGMGVGRNIVLAMVISGAFAGLAGAVEGLGTFEAVSVKSAFTGVGFNGIAVSLLGGNSALGIVIAALLFGGLQFGATNMPLNSGVPTEIVDVVIAIMIFFIASSYMIVFLWNKLKVRRAKR